MPERATGGIPARSGAADEQLSLDLRFTSEVMTRVVEFKRLGHNLITARVAENTDNYRTLVSLTVRMELDVGFIQQAVEECVPLFDCWTDWPPHHIPPFTQPRPLIEWDLEASFWVKAVYREQKTRFVILPELMPTPASTFLQVTFNVSNVFFNVYDPYPGKMNEFPAPISRIVHKLSRRPPLNHRHLSLSLEFFRSCSARTILHLDTPLGISTRSRFDNSDYYAHAIADEDEYRRNTSVFDKRLLILDYVFGTNSSHDLYAPGFPLLRVGIGLITGSFALHILTMPSGNGTPLPLASILLGLSLGAWFVEALRAKRLFSPSSVVHYTPFDEATSFVFGLVQLVFLIVVALVVGWYPKGRELVAGAGFILGAISLFGGTSYFAAVWLGTIQRYSCDNCRQDFTLRRETWFLKRFRQAHLEPRTRRVLCHDCYEKSINEYRS